MNKLNEFNWEKYESGQNGNKLIPNKNIKGQTQKMKCFSHEPYAQELFNILSSNSRKIVKKDLSKGDCVPVINAYYLSNETIMIELSGGISIDIDLNREKRFIQLFGYNSPKEFVQHLKHEETLNNFVSHGIYAYVVESSPLKVSLWEGHIIRTKEEFMKEISSPSKAYIAKIIEANRGGFFVEVQGVSAFMPGSLAAPNKIIDFESYVGNEVVVMIEDYLHDINSFIVSHKKYIEHILPQKIRELDLSKKYEGSITGTSKYGIFIEFDEIFTGLLHNSKMKDETLNKFNNRQFKPGDNIEFYINEITKDNRIILTEESPEEKTKKFNKFIVEYSDKEIMADVAAIMNFGVIINVNELSGLIPIKEFKKKNIPINNLFPGDNLKVKLLEFKNDKLVFNLIKQY